ncbi:DUF2510 domain-containing protein [Rugosimonospora africana]|uniref:DUF2510 domain-containing protein n=1 Tax=Rugosimonospora africana TaxID=556532 RepID=A0A8J3QRS3_9ACTN|nr:DUF2510 domain-containing protein [Rugosimonospora africana]GIH14480.1 hypothetical protein Raf01_26520 [Rugosimonospora africana]
MSQPGWYPDPYGGGQRWWDGATWTPHVYPSQAPPSQALPSQAVPSQAVGPVLNTMVDGKHLYADPRTVFYDGRSILLDQAEWVSYFTKTSYIQVGLVKSVNQREFHFEVGRYPRMRAPMVAMAFGKSTGAEHGDWRFLVDLSRRCLEPRLVADLAAKVRAGGMVEVGAGLAVHPGGIQGMSVSLAWDEVAGTSAKDGRIWIHKAGKHKPVLYVPEQNPNAVLIPALFAALGQRAIVA